jgi:O-antigen/teichoic acid export membrane protein
MNRTSSHIASNERSTGNISAAGLVTAEDGRERYKKIFEAGFSALFSKGAVLLVNAVSIPIAVRYLGSVQFGIWATITTSLSVLLVLDLGIANTLTNLISEAYAKEDQDLAGRYAATAFWMMVLVACILGFVGFAIWPFIGWDRIFHVDAASRSLTSRAVAVAYGVFLCGMPAGLAAKMLGGYQELRIANLFAAAGSVGSLAGIILVVRLRGGLPTLIGVSSGAMVLASGLCLFWIWFYHKPWLTPWPRKMSRLLSHRFMQSGSDFFMIQLAGLVVFNSDNLVIAHYAGAAEVTPYMVTWRLVSYASALQAIMIPALWPAYAEAFVRGDLGWVRKTFRRSMFLTMGMAAACCPVFFLGGRLLIRIWAGADAVPPQALLGWMCVWVLINTFMSNVSVILVAASETRVQAWSSVVAMIVNLALSILLVKSMGPVGVILGTVISYLLVLVGPQVWKAMQILQRPQLVSVSADIASRDYAKDE